MFKRIFVALVLVVMFLGLTGDQSKASTDIIYYSKNIPVYTWTTLVRMNGVQGGGICCVTPSNTIYVQQLYPDFRSCHYRVFHRLSGPNNDYHGPTYTFGADGNYHGISFPVEDGAYFDIQGDCDSYNVMTGYTYAN